ncbi:MAG: hypothetical protein GY910_19545 [bacterium]|nr:hypothetical protein [Deltaproteobacteria bacterium]MCP4907176.1 hypothetical protein [bacterium]
MSDPSPPPTGAPPPALLRAARRLLGPLVRLLLDHRITFPVLTGLLKSVYVEEANRAFAIPGRPQTISRLSLLTGIHRKDVKRLQAEAPEQSAAPTNVSLGAQLVLRWTAEPEYQEADGSPRALPRRAGDRSASSFEGLVESVTNDIRPRAILDEWIRLGIATVDAQDHVHLASNAFVPAHGFDEKAYYLGRNIRDHLAATRHNLTGQGPPLLERTVYYAHLRPGSVSELQDLASEVGLEALQRVNRRARELQREDEARSDATQRMNFGVYFYRAELEPDGEEDAAAREGGSDAT